MGAPDSQLRHDDELLLLQLPDECRDHFQAAADSGLARSAEEYWQSTLAGKSDHGISIMLEKLVAGLIAAHPASKDEKRTPELRLRDAVSAITGLPLRASNARDDDSLLREMTEVVEWDELPDNRLRAIARSLLSNQPPVGSEESAVRRLVSKYKAQRRKKSLLASGVDDLDAIAQHRALLYVQKALAAIGIPSRF